MNFKKIGVYSDLSYGDRREVALRDVPRLQECGDLQRWVQYLESGIVIAVAPGLSRDIFDAETIIGSLEILSDGTYIWPSDLAFYVRRYRCDLPGEFVRHMQNQKWRISEFDID